MTYYRNIKITVILFILAIAFAYAYKGVLFNVFVTFNGDSTAFLAFGKYIANGYIPFTDFWDHKSPPIHYLSFLAYIFSGGSYAGGLLLSVLATFIVICTWSILIFRRNQYIGILCLVLFYTLLKTNSEWVFMPELFCLFLTTISVYFVFKDEDIIYDKKIISLVCVGFFLFSSFLMKQLIIFDSILLIILLLRQYHTTPSNNLRFYFKIIAWILSGAFLSILLLLMPLFYWGNYSAAFECFMHNFNYSGGRLGLNIKEFDIAYLLPILVPYLIIFFIILKSKSNSVLGINKFILCSILFIWTTGSWFMSSGTHQHYMLTTWHPMIFSVFALSDLYSKQEYAYFYIPKLRYLILLIIPVLFLGSQHYFKKYDNEIIFEPEIFKNINELASSADTYFAFSNHNGASMLHLDIMPSQKYVYLAPIAHPGGDEVVSYIKQSLTEKMPDFLVITELDPFIAQVPNFVELHKFIHKKIIPYYTEISCKTNLLPMTDIEAIIYKKNEI